MYRSHDLPEWDCSVSEAATQKLTCNALCLLPSLAFIYTVSVLLSAVTEELVAAERMMIESFRGDVKNKFVKH